jgi:hypothetical protein
MKCPRFTMPAIVICGLIAPMLIGITPAAAATDSTSDKLRQSVVAQIKKLDTPQYDGKARLKTPAPTRSAAKAGPAKAGKECTPTGGGKEILCLSPSADHSDPSRLKRTSLSDGPLTLPQFCYDFAYRGWSNYREVGCSISAWHGEVKDLETKAVTGTVDFLLGDLAYTSDDAANFGRQILVSLTGATGSGTQPGTELVGTMSCDGVCSPVAQPFAPSPVTLENVAWGNVIFPTTVAVPGDIGYAATSVTFTLANPKWLPTPAYPTNPPLVRCDNQLPGVTYVGCVFPNNVPEMQYSRDGRFPELAQHIGDAQASGLPGAAPDGTPLTRLTDQTLRDRNGDTACPGRYLRPDTKNCDEYPFRSTYQGAYTADPRGPARTFDWCQVNEPAGTGPVGYSVCMIDADQNNRGASALGQFYIDERVLDRDGFRVGITGTGGGGNPNPPDHRPVVDAGPDVTAGEGSWADLGGSATDDHGAPRVSWSYSAGPDADPGTICQFGNGFQAATNFSCTDDGTFTVTLSADDGVHDTPSTDTAIVHIYYVESRLKKLERIVADPALGIVSPAPWQVFKVGDPVTLTTNFTDDGANDTQTCAIGWDDGTSTSGAATGYVCGGVHRYQHAGMYTIKPVITDDDGGVSEAASLLVIVYDLEPINLGLITAH